MNYKTLILGSAATLMLVGGAQAADLAVASAVEYVKVCSMYGAGYFYLPGSDMCLHIGASVRERMGYQSPASSQVAGTKNYWSQTEAVLQVTSKWVSSFGDSMIDVQFTDDTSEGSNAGKVGLDHASGKLGGFVFGYQNTMAENYTPFTDAGGFSNDHKNDNFGYIASMGGMGVGVSIENDNSYWKNDTPEFAAAVTGGMGGLNFKLSGAVVTNRPGIGTGYGVAFGGEWGKAGGLQLRGNVSWAHNAAVFAGGDDIAVPTELGNVWSAFASLQAPLGAGATAQLTVARFDAPGSANDVTRVAAGAVFAVSSAASLQTEVQWNNMSGGSNTGVFFGAKVATP